MARMMSRGRLIDFLLAAVIFGFAVVWAVPWAALALAKITPASVQAKLVPYLPTAKAPGFTMQAAGQAAVFGAFLALILIILRKVGVRRQIDGIQA